ncbi:hypothetical protein DPEC_G00258580 [Dallia pectoralis]|uniref:Uncharacterized protein n=1 Tax=Dallia pectoralis TaxID=75939 RepID=A0ACC2FRG7_DALPE|nr:hypothetical protein DPEC_G00258580 [Dallia pectoralis]
MKRQVNQGAGASQRVNHQGRQATSQNECRENLQQRRRSNRRYHDLKQCFRLYQSWGLDKGLTRQLSSDSETMCGSWSALICTASG